MTFLIDAAPDELADGTAFQRYMAYVESIKDKLGPSVYAFATSKRHQSSPDPASLHDSWVESILVRETPTGKRHEVRMQEIVITLLGAYHDRRITIRYVPVTAYAATVPNASRGHGDWLIDEIGFDGSNPVHTIVFSSGARWVISFCEIKIEEQLLEPPAAETHSSVGE